MCAESPVRAQQVASPVDAATAADEPSAYVVAVPTEPELDPFAARAAASARQALRKVAGIRWQDADRRVLGYDEASWVALTEAKTALAEGRQAYLQLELDRAVDRLSYAIEQFDAAATVLEGPAELGEALLFLGASQTFAGKNRDARSTFRRLHIQMPQLEPDPNVFPPDVVRRYAAASPRDRSDPRGVIQVDSDVPGALVEVDYLPRGRAPMAVQGLTIGVHVVRVTRPGSAPHVEVVRVRSARPAEVSAILETSEAGAGIYEGTAQVKTSSEATVDEQGLSALVARLELSRIALVRVAPGGDATQVRLEVLVFDGTSGRRVMRGEGPSSTAPSELEASVAALVAGPFDAGLRAPEAPVVQRTEEGERPAPVKHEEPAIYTKWWFWTAVGVVVVGAAGGAYLLWHRDNGGNADSGGQLVLEF